MVGYFPPHNNAAMMQHYRRFIDNDATLPPRPLTSQSFNGDPYSLKRRADYNFEIHENPKRKTRSFDAGRPSQAVEEASQPPPLPAKDFAIPPVFPIVELEDSQDSPPPPLPTRDYEATSLIEESQETQPPPLPIRDFQSTIHLEDSQESQPPLPPPRDFLYDDVPAETESNLTATVGSDYLMDVDDVDTIILDSQPPPPPIRDFLSTIQLEASQEVQPPPLPAKDYSITVIQPTVQPIHDTRPLARNNTLYAVCSQGVESYRIEESTAQIQTMTVASQSSMASAISLDSLAVPTYMMPPPRTPAPRRSLPIIPARTSSKTVNLPPWPAFRQEFPRSRSDEQFNRPNVLVSNVQATKSLPRTQERNPPQPPARLPSVTDSWYETVSLHNPNQVPDTNDQTVDLSMGQLSALSFLCRDEDHAQEVEQEPKDQALEHPADQRPTHNQEDEVEKEISKAVQEEVAEQPENLTAGAMSALSFLCREESEEDEERDLTIVAEDVKDQPLALTASQRSALSFLCREEEEVTDERNLTVVEKIIADKPLDLSAGQRSALSFLCREDEEAAAGGNLTVVEENVAEQQEMLTTQQQSDLSFFCAASLTDPLPINQAPIEEPVQPIKEEVVEQEAEAFLTLPVDKPAAVDNDKNIYQLEAAAAEITENVPVDAVKQEVIEEESAMLQPIPSDMELTIESYSQTVLNQVSVHEEEEDLSLLNRDDPPALTQQHSLLISQSVNDRQRSMLEFSACQQSQEQLPARESQNLLEQNNIEDTLVVGVNFEISYENFDENLLSAVKLALFG